MVKKYWFTYMAAYAGSRIVLLAMTRSYHWVEAAGDALIPVLMYLLIRKMYGG